MLARCLPGILPELEPDEALDVAKVWAAAARGIPSRVRPPFRSPHHTATRAALVGGGSGIPVPGEVSLAHRGVLFLDELGEFGGALLDTLRQPVEDGSITVARKGVSAKFPSSVQLVAATNPCPCGYREDTTVPCECSSSARDRYRRRLSGPLLDRFDLRVQVPRLDKDSLTGNGGEPSATVRERVVADAQTADSPWVPQPEPPTRRVGRGALDHGGSSTAHLSHRPACPDGARVRPHQASGANGGRPRRIRRGGRAPHWRSPRIPRFDVNRDAHLRLAFVGMHPDRKRTVLGKYGGPEGVLTAIRSGACAVPDHAQRAASVPAEQRETELGRLGASWVARR